MMHKGPPKKIKVTSLDDYLEIMSKSVFETGMSWKVIESKWPDTKEAFFNFNIKKVSRFTEKDIDRLMHDTRVIRNYNKLMAIIMNANTILEKDKEYGTFKNYLRSKKTFDEKIKTLIKDFKFLGPMGTYVFLWIVGEKVIPHEEFQKRYR